MRGGAVVSLPLRPGEHGGYVRTAYPLRMIFINIMIFVFSCFGAADAHVPAELR